MRKKTTKRYIATILCYVAFILRIELGNIQLEESLALELQDSNAAVALIQALKNTDGDTTAVTAVHNLLMVTLCRIRSNPFETSPCPFVLFLIFKNTTLSGMIRQPEDISGIISELKWPLRATGFHEIVIRLKDIKARENVGMEMGENVGAEVEENVGADWQSEVQEVSVEGDSPILK